MSDRAQEIIEMAVRHSAECVFNIDCICGADSLRAEAIEAIRAEVQRARDEERAHTSYWRERAREYYGGLDEAARVLASDDRPSDDTEKSLLRRTIRELTRGHESEEKALGEENARLRALLEQCRDALVGVLDPRSVEPGSPVDNAIKAANKELGR